MSDWWLDPKHYSFSEENDEFITHLIADIMSDDFIYDSNIFTFASQPGSKSLLDHQLETTWNSRVESGCFRYIIGDLLTKYLEGNYKFVVQLNADRAVQRRRPQEITDISMPFDPNNFHFGKVPEPEKMFHISSVEWGVPKLENNHDTYKHALIINVSPLEQFHCLFVPNIDLCCPQVLTFEGFRAAVEVILASNDSYMRMGFNSLGAFASVNHLHFHLYHLKHKLYLETAPVEQLFGPCYYMITYPAEGFAFEILSPRDICKTVRAVMTLVEYLIQRKIPHNIFLTRGAPFSTKGDFQGVIYRSLRIFVWAREAYYGTKLESSGFNVAVCELSGHIPTKDQETYEAINEDTVIQKMRQTCHDAFVAIREDVNSLFINRFSE